MVRGISIGGTASPVTGFSVQINKNPITEEGLYNTVASNMFHGAETVSGSCDLIYRTGDELTTLIGAINNSNLRLSALCKDIVAYGDKSGDAFTFASAIINTIDITASAKDFVKLKYGFTAKHAINASGSATAPTYSDTVGIFYSSTVNVAGTLLHTNSLTLHLEVPIDTDYFVLGNPWLYDYYQSSLANITGSVEISADDYAVFRNMVGSTAYDMNINNTHALSLYGGTITFIVGTTDGAILNTISLANCKFTDGSMDITGRQRINRTLNFSVIAPSSGNIITVS